MRPTETNEAEALASLLGRTPAAEALAAGGSARAEPPVPVTRKKAGRVRLLTVLAASFASVLVLIFLLAPLTENWHPFAGAASFAVALAVISWCAARAGGGRLPGLGAKAAQQALVWSAIALGAMAWCLLALAIGGRLTADGAPVNVAVAIGLVATLLQAAGEELFFRGWVQPTLERLARPSVALVATAGTFAAIHLAGNWFAPLSLLNILLAGLWFGLLAQHSGGLAAPIAAHWAWNGAELCIFGLYPNPGVGPWGALFGRDITGAAIWGGGEEGLNASLLTSLTLGAIIILLTARRRAGSRIQLT